MTQPTHTRVDFSEASLFVGREPFLQMLHTTLQGNRRVVLAGQSGVGKTAVAREYVQRFSQQYQCVCWMNMATDETLLADLLAALQSLSLPINMNQGIAGLFRDLRHYLSMQQDFLLILDNPPRPSLLPDEPGQPQMGGHLLLITPALTTPPEVPCLELPGLSMQEGALLVLRRAGLLAAHATLDQVDEEQRLAALELARELHGWPLSYHLAGGYLRETGWSVREYLFAFRDCPGRLYLPVSAGDEDLSELAVACELRLAHLEGLHSAVLEELQVRALLLSEAQPGGLFPRGGESLSDAVPSEPVPTSDLLSIGYEAATLDMHPLLQACVRQFFVLEHPQRQLEQALRCIQRSLPALVGEPLSTRIRVAGHIRHLAQLSEEQPLLLAEAAEVFNWAASLLWEQGLIGTAETLLSRALAIWEQSLGSTHPGVATVLVNLATLNGLLKNYAEAEALSHRAIASKSAALGVNHPDVLFALTHLGHVYAEQGKQLEARLCYEKAISTAERVGLRHHPIYTTVRYDLALLFIQQEQFAPAEDLLRRVCLVWSQNPGSQDPATMAARFSLAETSARLKKWERAETSYRQALPVCEQLLGEEHPVTLSHLERAALVFLHLGNSAEATLNLRRVLAVRERTLGLQHPEVARCLNGLARVALEQGQIPEALALLERAQRIYASQAELDKFALTDLLDTLAAAEAAQGHLEQALMVAQRALDLRRTLLGKEHVGLVENLHTLATFHIDLEQLQSAESLLLQALSLYQNAEKPEDLVLDPTLNLLAELEIKRQHVAQARMYLERSRAVREVSLGHSDPRTQVQEQRLAELSTIQAPSEQKK